MTNLAKTKNETQELPMNKLIKEKVIVVDARTPVSKKEKRITEKTKVAPKVPTDNKGNKAKPETKAPASLDKKEATKEKPKASVPAANNKGSEKPKADTVKADNKTLEKAAQKAKADTVKPDSKASVEPEKTEKQDKVEKITISRRILDLYSRPDGATDAELVKEFGWKGKHVSRGWRSTQNKKYRESGSDKQIMGFTRKNGERAYKLETVSDTENKTENKEAKDEKKAA